MMLKTALKDNKGSAQNWIMAIAFLLIVGAGVYVLVFKNLKPKLTGDTKPSDTTAVTTEEEEFKHQALTVTDIAKRPNVYENKKVLLLRVQTSTWITDRGFLMSDVPPKSKTGSQSTPPKIMAFRKEAFDLPENAADGMIALGEDKRLMQIEGTVVYFDVDIIGSQMGLTFSEADYKALKKYNKKPVVIIESIQPYVAKE
jgi:hypothetical protein